MLCDEKQAIDASEEEEEKKTIRGMTVSSCFFQRHIIVIPVQAALAC
jgi:hypothetical protein